MAEYANLNQAERERLECLVEEAAEVIQICTKILRHGYKTKDRLTNTSYDNAEMLRTELLDLWTVAERMIFHGDIGRIDFMHSGAVWQKKMAYMHHQFHNPFDRPKEDGPAPPPEYSNAQKTGWRDYFKGKVRGKTIYPLSRPELHINWLFGWDAAKKYDDDSKGMR